MITEAAPPTPTMKIKTEWRTSLIRAALPRHDLMKLRACWDSTMGCRRSCGRQHARSLFTSRYSSMTEDSKSSPDTACNIDRARPCKRRHPIRPGCDTRRGSCSGFVDDLEMRGDQCPIWGRQRRGYLRSLASLTVGTGTHHSSIHGGAFRIHRTGNRCSAPDVNTNDQTMAWIMDTYSMHARHTSTAVVTGKPHRSRWVARTKRSNWARMHDRYRASSAPLWF